MPSRSADTASGALATPLDGVDLLLADLDGVVYAGPGALPYAVESINRAQESIRVGYITNNASRTADSVAEHLTELGLTVVGDDVVTSPQAAIVLLEELVPAGFDDPGRRGRGADVGRRGARLPRHAIRRGCAGGRDPGIPPERRLDRSRRGRLRAEGARRWRPRHPVGRDEHRLDDPAGARHGAGQRHARVGRPHGGRAAADRRRQARARDLRRRGRAVRRIQRPGPGRSARHRHPGREPRRHRLRPRSDRDRRAQAGAGGRRGFAADLPARRPARAVRAVSGAGRGARRAHRRPPVPLGGRGRAPRRQRGHHRRGRRSPDRLARAGTPRCGGRASRSTRSTSRRGYIRSP